jgi:hypothetical protein
MADKKTIYPTVVFHVKKETRASVKEWERTLNAFDRRAIVKEVGRALNAWYYQ